MEFAVEVEMLARVWRKNLLSFHSCCVTRHESCVLLNQTFVHRHPYECPANGIHYKTVRKKKGMNVDGVSCRIIKHVKNTVQEFNGISVGNKSSMIAQSEDSISEIMLMVQVCTVGTNDDVRRVERMAVKALHYDIRRGSQGAEYPVCFAAIDISMALDLVCIQTDSRYVMEQLAPHLSSATCYDRDANYREADAAASPGKSEHKCLEDFSMAYHGAEGEKFDTNINTKQPVVAGMAEILQSIEVHSLGGIDSFNGGAPFSVRLSINDQLQQHLFIPSMDLRTGQSQGEWNAYEENAIKHPWGSPIWDDLGGLEEMIKRKVNNWIMNLAWVVFNQKISEKEDDMFSDFWKPKTRPDKSMLREIFATGDVHATRRNSVDEKWVCHLHMAYEYCRQEIRLDILVFNTYDEWMGSLNMKSPWSLSAHGVDQFVELYLINGYAYSGWFEQRANWFGEWIYGYKEILADEDSFPHSDP